MHNRRKFLAKSSLTLGAVSFLKPLQSIAGSGMLSQQQNTLTILFTNGLQANSENTDGIGSVKDVVQDLRRKAQNILLLDTGNMLPANTSKTIDDLHLFKTLKQTGYDAVTPGTTDLQHGAGYYTRLVDRSRMVAVAAEPVANESVMTDRIIRKGTLKIGVIGVGGAEELSTNGFQQLLRNINSRAKKLKQTHRCQLVVCLSHLPLKDEAGEIDNFHLAQATNHVDVVLSANDGRYTYNSHVVKNSSGHDVFISHAGKDGTMLGKLKIGFNERGEKTTIATELVFISSAKMDNTLAFRKHLADQMA